MQESLVFSHLHTPEASCPFLQESSGVSAAEPLWIYSGSTAGLRHSAFVSVKGGAVAGELTVLSWRPVLLVGRRAQLSAAEG